MGAGGGAQHIPSIRYASYSMYTLVEGRTTGGGEVFVCLEGGRWGRGRVFVCLFGGRTGSRGVLFVVEELAILE